MTSSIFIYAKVPEADSPTCPLLVFYENGDWNIEFAGDVEFIKSNILTTLNCAMLLQLFSDEEFDYDSEGCDIYLELEVESDIEEPVVLIWCDGRATAGDRFQAENLIRNGNTDFYNYIPLSELVEDIAKFITRHSDMMFDDSYGDDDFQPLNFDED